MIDLDVLIAYPFSTIKADGKLIIGLLQLSERYFKLPYTDCENEQIRYFKKLKTLKNKTMPEQKSYLDKKYILRGTTLLYYNGTHFNNDTLTDKIAGNAIKKFPDLVGIFLNEKEMNVLRAKVNAGTAVAVAEDAVLDEPIETNVKELIDEGKLDEARAEAGKILVAETRDALLKEIEAREKAAEAKKAKDAEAEKKAEAESKEPEKEKEPKAEPEKATEPKTASTKKEKK